MNCGPAQSGAVTATADYVLSGSIDGHVRGYAAADGRVLWDYDMIRSFDTTNQLKASGGSLDSAGPTVAAGMVFVFKAGILSGRFYISAAAMFATASIMPLVPEVSILLFGIVSALSFFIPGLKYYKQRRRALQAKH